jgi:hypothetical protein
MEEFSTMALFELQAKESELSKLADEYWQQSGERERQLERSAYEAGASILNGDYSLANLEVIVRWKSERVVHYLIGNSETIIRQILALVANPETPLRLAIESLTSLRGIDMHVATAVLSVVHPEKYAVLDFRTLVALGHERHNIDFYQKYTDYLAKLTKQVGIKAQEDMPGPAPLHTLERALWEYSRKRNDRQGL